MKLNYLLTLFLLFHLTSYSQRPNFKQLKADVDAAETKESKARALVNYAFAIPSREYDDVIKVSEEISELGKNNDNPELFKALSTFTKGLSFYRKQDLKGSKPYLKESITQLSILKDPLEVKALNLLGIVYQRTNHRDSAIYVYKDILSRKESLNTKAIQSAHANLSNAYRATGDYYEAINHMEQLFALDSTNTFTILQMSMNTAKIYDEMNMEDKALKSLQRVTIDTFPEVPPKGVFYHTLGSLHKNKNQLDSALYYYKRAFETSMAIDYKPLQATDLGNVIQTKMELDSLDELDVMLDEMKALSANSKNNVANIRYLLLLSRYQKSLKQYDSAITNLNKASSYITENPMLRDYKSDVYQDLVDLYNLKDNTSIAKQYIDSLTVEQQNPALKKQEQFEAEAKAKYLLAVKEKELVEKDEKVKSFTTQRILLVVLAIGLLIASFFYFKNYKKSSVGLKEQQSENEKLAKQVARQNTTIVELRSKAILEAEEITFIKSDGHYLEFALKSKKNPELDRNKLKDVLDKLPDYFVQIHRSYIINLKEIKIKYATKVLMKDGVEVPISRTYKSQLNEAIDRFNS